MHKLRFTIPILLAAVLACISPAFGASNKPKVVLVIADYLSLPDLIAGDHPAISRLVSYGGVGLISSGGPGTRLAESAYATASAGSTSWGNSSVNQSFSASETKEDEPDSAQAIFHRRTGGTTASGVVELDLGPLIRENKDRPSAAMPCALGDVLHQAGKKTAVFGNSDLFEDIHRRAAILASTSQGSIDMGDVSSRVTRPERFSPVGFVTDSSRMADDVNAALKSADFIVVDFGDTTRVELMKTQLSAQAYKIHRKNAIANLDSFLNRIISGNAGDATIILASLVPPRRLEDGDPKRLAPILVSRPGSIEGAVISTTTRTAGLISVFDLAPTVLTALGVSKSGAMIGSPITVAPAKQSAALRLNSLVALNAVMLWPLLSVLATLGISTIIIACLVLFFKKAAWARPIVKTLIVLSMSSPTAMIFATQGTPELAPFLIRQFSLMAAFTAGSFAVAALLKRLWPERLSRMLDALPIVVLSIATCIVLFVDAIHGGQLVRYTLINSSDFEGFRFYGIGNEYMGVWLGMALIAIVWLRECWSGIEGRRLGRLLILAVSIAIISALGFPHSGANAGGAVAAVVGLGLAYISGVKKRFSVWDAFILTAVGVATVVGIGFLDLKFSPTAPSHIGLTASMGERQGYSYIFAIVARKITMNLGLLATKQSIAALWGGVPLAALWFLGVGRKVNGMLADRPRMVWGIRATLVCTAVAFLFNDSGAVAGGLIFAYLVIALLYSALSAGDVAENSRT